MTAQSETDYTGAAGEAVPPADSASAPVQPLSEALQIEQNDLVVFAEDGKFYLVPETVYTASPLPEALWAAPEFVVGFGAVAADLEPFDDESKNPEEPHAPDELHELTEGVACIVLNLASLMNDREKLGAPKVTPKVQPQRGAKNGNGSLLEKGDGLVPEATELKVDRRDILIFDPQGNFYWVKYKEHLDPSQHPPIPDSLTSAPLVAAGLGTVLADIPFLPTVGCSCFLVNLALLRRGGAEAAKLVRRAMKAADDRQKDAKAEVAKMKAERYAPKST